MRGMEQVRWTALAALFLATGTNASPLADAAEQQKWSEVRELARSASEINAPQADGANALLWAAHHDSLATVTLLLERGAEPDVANRYGITPLAEAALNGNAAMVERLLAAGADPNKTPLGGDTPLMLAARSGNATSVKLLLEKSAAVDVRETWHGETALMWAAGENHPDVVRLLVKAGADVNAVSTTFDWKGIKHGGVESQLPMGGLTALMHAARQNSIEAAIALLELGANPDLKDPQGISTLRIAISNAHLDLAHELLKGGADPDEGALVDAVKVRTTTIMRAATNRTNKLAPIDLINALLAHGAQADSLAAVAMPKKDAFEVGSRAGVSPSETALFLAASANDMELMQLMVEHGANVNHANKDGITVLMTSLGIRVKRANGATPPPALPMARRLQAATWLLDRGSAVNAADTKGITALHAIAEMGEDPLVQFLVDRGARLDAKDSSNRMVLDMAKGVPPLPAPGAIAAPPDPRTLAQPSESTIALVRTLMASAKVREVPYVVPVAQEAKAPAPVPAATVVPGGERKQVIAIIPQS